MISPIRVNVGTLPEHVHVLVHINADWKLTSEVGIPKGGEAQALPAAKDGTA